MCAAKANFLPHDEQRFYDGCVHGLRSRGWSKADAESEAIARVDKMRRAKP